eukprot:7446718-Karenia_brevis.AAC.1
MEEMQKQLIANHEALPIAVKHCIPTILQLMPNKPFWSPALNLEQQPQQLYQPKYDHINNMSREGKHFIGIMEQYEAKQPFTEWLQQYAHMDAEQAFLVINGAEDVFQHPPLPQPVAECAPTDIDAWSDGSFTMPDTPLYGLMTAAVWWPMRTSEISDLEYMYTHTKRIDSGIE